MSAQLRAYRNNGNNTFTLFNIPGAANQGFRNGALAVGDSDNDGDLDAAVAGNRPASGNNREIWVYRNNGGFGFTQFNVESGANLGLRDGGLAWADYNGDNKIDILVTGTDAGGARQMRVYQNAASTANTAPAAPTVHAATGSAQSTTVTVGTNDTYYFALWSQDDVGEWSLISNIASAAPAALNRSVSVTSGSPWSIGSALPTSANVAVLSAGFHPTRPALGDFAAEDVVTGSAASDTETAQDLTVTIAANP